MIKGPRQTVALAANVAIVSTMMAFLPACAPMPAAPTQGGLKWSISPRSQNVRVGEATTFTISITNKTDINARVNLSAVARNVLSQPVPGVTLSFNPPRVPETGTSSVLTVQTAPDTTLEGFSIDITAAEDGGESLTDFVSVRVEPGGAAPDFSLTVDPAQLTLGGGTLTGSVRARIFPFNLTGDISLAISGGGPAVTVENPSQTLPAAPNANTIFDVRLVPGIPVSGPVLLTLTATSGTIVRTAVITVTIAGATSPGR